MTDPTGEAFLHGLEHTIREELIEAERSEPLDTPFDQWRYDPTEVQREEIGLRSLLGAVEAVEGQDDIS